MQPRPGRPPEAATDGQAESDLSDWEPTVAGAHLRGRAVSNTAPEMRLRSALHARGLRYRLRRQIGRFRPDLVFPGARVAVFVDGCFWHGCPVHGADEFRGPNAEKWRDKLAANKARDLRAVEELKALHWRVIRIWECDTKRDVDLAAERVRQVVQEATSSAARS